MYLLSVYCGSSPLRNVKKDEACMGGEHLGRGRESLLERDLLQNLEIKSILY